MRRAGNSIHTSQSGFTLIELMVAIVIAMTVMAGVVQVLVVSKSNFVTGRELATLQENARYAMKYLSDEIRMAGFTGCSSQPPHETITIETTPANSWYLNFPGIEGFEFDAGIGLFPLAFQANVKADTDSVIVRRSESTAFRVSFHTYVATPPVLTVNNPHFFQRGQPVVITNPSCDQVAVFQMSGPENAANTSVEIAHDTGTVTPGNCTFYLGGDSSTCPSSATSLYYRPSSIVRALRSEAYYIRASQADPSVPSLYRERMSVEADAVITVPEELVKGVENMQILYGIDQFDPSGAAPPDGVAERYVTANNVPDTLVPPFVRDWDSVVSVRLSLRVRSLLPVYNTNVDFGEFEGVDGTDGSDRYLRQDLSTIITVRNH